VSAVTLNTLDVENRDASRGTVVKNISMYDTQTNFDWIDFVGSQFCPEEDVLYW